MSGEQKSATDELCEELRRNGLLGAGAAQLTPFGGGVSSDVWLVEQTGRESFVVKKCLPKLRVKADWFADPARVHFERRYLETVNCIAPGCVPRLLNTGRQSDYIAMEFLGGFENWKTRLLRGDARIVDAQQAGALLGRVHSATRGDSAVAREFDTLALFKQLRIEAYLLATARAHPQLAAEFEREAERLAATRECLVHGDYSPKNMLLGEGRLVVLDAETAWFGDGAFDLAFLMNHLHLKAIHHAPADRGLRELVSAARTAYLEAAGRDDAFDRRTARLLLMLLLARVDGKSPAEYLTEPKRERIREFVLARLEKWRAPLEALSREWFDFLQLEHDPNG